MGVSLNKIRYASIAVVDHISIEKVAIESISITDESCDLSGAWLVDSKDSELLSNILSGKLIIELGSPESSNAKVELKLQDQISIQDFLDDARQEIEVANKLFTDHVERNLQEYSSYMQIAPAERKLMPKVVKKNLVPPDFSNWPGVVDMNNPEQELRKLGKLESISGTQLEMKRVLAASRLLQILLYMWKNDEVERNNRVYVLGSDAEMTILPKSWMSKLPVFAG
jgi:hypothetical protein